jgi:UDP-GlcNAc:undecaprenyl-phosphate GlcNAc-1-phosphate transferase
MLSVVVAFVVALVVTAAATPVVRRIALRLQVIDEPTARRVHVRSIPRLGGIAIVLGFFVSLGALFFFETDVGRLLFSHTKLVGGIALGALMVAALGAYDDIVGASARTKLAVQTMAALMAYGAGYRIDAIDIPGLGATPLGFLAIPATVVWIVAVINALNLIDGLDGLAAGVAFFACVTNFVIAGMDANVLICLVAATLAGALLGFWFYNFNPATIFMGDSGSMFLGFVIATMSIFGAGSSKSGTAIAIAVPLLALGLPLIDMMLAMVRRFLARRSIFSADRGHIHHRLIDIGLTHQRAVLVLYAVCALFTTFALAMHFGESWQLGITMTALVVTVVGGARFLNYYNRSMSTRRRDEDVERLRRAVPRFVQDTAALQGPLDVRALLEQFAREAGMVWVSVGPSNGDSGAAWKWQREGTSERCRREAVRSSYALATADGGQRSVTFAWDSVIGAVSPQSDILLQLVVDAVESRNVNVPMVPVGAPIPLLAETDTQLRLVGQA